MHPSVVPEDVEYLPGEILFPIGLAKEFHFPMKMSAILHRRFGKSRREQNLDVRPELFRLKREAGSRHASGQDDIGEQKVDQAAPLKDRERRRRVVRLLHLMTQPQKLLDDDPTDIRIVLDHEDCGATRYCRGVRRGRSRRYRLFLGTG